MNFDDTPQEAEFRTRARAFLSKHLEKLNPDETTPSLLGEREDKAAIDWAKRWQATKFDAGWAVLTWPKEYGGQGLGRMENVIFNQEEARFKTPPAIYGIGHGMLGPTLMTHGTKEQKERYIKEMARGQVVWCQLFSEPAAGSDLAGLRSNAVRDGDGWVLNGQKIWSTGAQYCDWGMIVVRTDPNVPKHDGLTYFIVDMKAKGVEVRPIKQINGGSGFNEVFFTNVRVPDSQRLGGVGEGWKVSITTLMNERVSIGAGTSGSRIRDIFKLARECRRSRTVRCASASPTPSSPRRVSSTRAIGSCRRSRAGRRRGPRDRSARRSARPSGNSSPPSRSSSRGRWAGSSTRPSPRSRRSGRRATWARRACGSPAAPTRCSATSSPSACSGCPRRSAWTRACRSATCRRGR